MKPEFYHVDFLKDDANGHVIKRIERGRIAFWADDLKALQHILDENTARYLNYGATFSEE